MSVFLLLTTLLTSLFIETVTIVLLNKACFKRRANVVSNLIVGIFNMKSTASKTHYKFGAAELGSTRRYLDSVSRAARQKLDAVLNVKLCVVPSQTHTFYFIQKVLLDFQATESRTELIWLDGGSTFKTTNSLT